jgi:hypothetical protein
MLIVALILAVFCYITLYLVWIVLSPHVNPTATTLTIVRDMLFSLPSPAPLAILKWAIILIAFYLIADALLAPTRWKRRANAFKGPMKQG